MSKRDELASVIAARLNVSKEYADWPNLRHKKGQVIADAVLAWLGGQFGEGLRDVVAEVIHAHRMDMSHDKAVAAIAAVRDHLGLDGAATDAQEGLGAANGVDVGLGSTVSPVGRENDTSGIQESRR